MTNPSVLILKSQKKFLMVQMFVFFPLSTACLWSLFALFRNRDDCPFECLIIFFLSPEKQGLSSDRALQSSVTNLLEEWYLRKLQNFHFLKKFPFLCCNLNLLLFLQWSGWSCGTYGIGWYLSLSTYLFLETESLVTWQMIKSLGLQDFSRFSWFSCLVYMADTKL